METDFILCARALGRELGSITTCAEGPPFWRERGRGVREGNVTEGGSVAAGLLGGLDGIRLCPPPRLGQGPVVPCLSKDFLGPEKDIPGQAETPT